MSIIKELKLNGVQGAYIPSLAPQNFEPDMVQEESIDPKALLVEQLNNLDEVARKSLLAETFAEEISGLVNEAKEDGFKQGQELAKTAIEEAILEEKEALIELIETWTNNVNQSLQEKAWTIEDEGSICELLFTSLCQLLTTTLATPSNTHEILKSIVAQYVDKSIKEIAVSEAQYNHLKELNALDKFGDDVTVVSDENMLSGSYKVSLLSGSVEHQMYEALSQFKLDLEAIALGDVTENA